MDEARRWELRKTLTYETDVELAGEWLIWQSERRRAQLAHPRGRRRKTDRQLVVPAPLCTTPWSPPLSGTWGGRRKKF